MKNLLDGRICFVTGAGRGIGKEIAVKFAREGGVVYANALHEESVRAWMDGAEGKENIRPLCFDITDSPSLRNAVMQIKREAGRIDVLVNNAGLISYEPMSMVTRQHMERMFAVNVFAAFEAIQLVSRIMERQGGGSIVNMASMVGKIGASGQTAYAASKGAVISMTKSSAKELVGKNIRVNAIAPAMVGTERLLNQMENRFSYMKDRIGMGRVARPEEIADVALFLASDMSSYITGQIIGVEGCTLF